MTVQRWSHLGLCVADLDRSRRFYVEGLGFDEVSTLEVRGLAVDTLLELEDTQLRAVYLERDGARLELLGFASPGVRGKGTERAMNQLGLTHLSFRVENADAVASRLQQLGGRRLDATRTSNEEFQAIALFVLDPDGTRLELVQQPGDPSRLPGED